MADEKTAATLNQGEGNKFAPQRRGKMRGRNKMLLIIFSILLMGFMRTGFIFLIMGLLPSIVIYFLDRSRNQHMFKSVFCCNLAAMMESIVKILSTGPNSTVMQNIMNDALNWLTIYGAAIGGLMLVQIMPVIAESIINGLHQGQISRLYQNQQRIEKEWGQEVTQFSTPDGTEQQEPENIFSLVPSEQQI